MHTVHTPHLDDHFRTICRANKWKCTAQRRTVFTCLAGNREHPTVEMVWNDARGILPDLSLDSVYRILDDFANAGLLRRLQGRVLRYDPDLEPHDHYVCTRCGRIFDFHREGTERAADLCRRFGSVDLVDLVVRGICLSCQGIEQSGV